MSGKKTYLALCAIAIGKSVVQPGKPLPPDVSAGKIKSLLGNGSIEPATGDTTATLVGAVTKDGRVVELGELKVDELKKLATDMEIVGATKMKKDELVDAIAAAEFTVDESGEVAQVASV